MQNRSRNDPGPTGTKKERIGSPRDHLCTNTGPATTATSPSTREEIKTIDPVPLYLVPPVVTAAVNRIGGALSELHAWRSRRHFYEVALVIREEGER